MSIPKPCRTKIYNQKNKESIANRLRYMSSNTKNYVGISALK